MADTDIARLKHKAAGALHDHRSIYLDPAAVLKLIAENERLKTEAAACAKCRKMSVEMAANDDLGAALEKIREITGDGLA